MADVTIWHNPSCGSSRNALAYLEEKGATPRVYLYLKEKPDQAAITEVLERLGVPPSQLLRPKEKIAEELGLYADGVDEDAILKAMVENARLIQRPVVITSTGAVIARPKTKIDEVL